MITSMAAALERRETLGEVMTAEEEMEKSYNNDIASLGKANSHLIIKVTLALLL